MYILFTALVVFSPKKIVLPDYNGFADYLGLSAPLSILIVGLVQGNNQLLSMFFAFTSYALALL